jgi:hypothetical protein
MADEVEAVHDRATADGPDPCPDRRDDRERQRAGEDLAAGGALGAAEPRIEGERDDGGGGEPDPSRRRRDEPPESRRRPTPRQRLGRPGIAGERASRTRAPFTRARVDQRRDHRLVRIADAEDGPSHTDLGAGAEPHQSRRPRRVGDQSVDAPQVLDQKRPRFVGRDPGVTRIDVRIIEDEVVRQRAADRHRQRVEAVAGARAGRVRDLENHCHAMRSR